MLMELNDPGPADPILVTGNSELTQQVLLAVLSTTTLPLGVLFTDTRGDTLDMALILGSFTAERIGRSLDGVRKGGPLILPGLAGSLADGTREVTGRPVEVGPICAAELPLVFGERWDTGQAAPV
jgi:CO dehydrogenase/acetyl-CoA synthase gamma subunit (corrinoid Fe-S protein)